VAVQTVDVLADVGPLDEDSLDIDRGRASSQPENQEEEEKRDNGDESVEQHLSVYY